MKIHEMRVKNQRKQRVGRGTGSGRGKTSGRGMDGQNSRSGGGVRPGFEGGQNPYMKRIPKVRGFKRSSKPLSVIHTDQLNVFKADQKVGRKELKAAGLIDSESIPVKLLRRGELKISVSITLDRASKSALAAVTEAGGNVTIGSGE